MKKQTHISKVRTMYAANAKSILELGIDSDSYNQKLFEVGIRLLEEHFPRETKYEKYYQLHAKSEKFWTWFKSEWKLWERNFIEFLREDENLSLEDWEQDLEQMALDSDVDNSFFHNYLKHLKII